MVTPEESRRDAQTVQISHSPLQLIASDVHWFTMNAVYNNAKMAPEKQPVMCDFEVVKDLENPTRFYITLLVELENSQPIEGMLAFSMSTVSLLEYRFFGDPTPLPADDDTRWYIFEDGLDAAIAAARGYLTNFLAPTIYRGYLLPMLNIQELIRRKYNRPALALIPSVAPNEKPPGKTKQKKD